MTYYADSDQRAAVIAGLRELADFLEANPGVPVNHYRPAEAPCSVLEEDWPTACTEIERIADLLSVDSRSAARGHHRRAVREFRGGVRYEAAAVSPEDMDAHHALHSYRDAFRAPDIDAGSAMPSLLGGDV